MRSRQCSHRLVIVAALCASVPFAHGVIGAGFATASVGALQPGEVSSLTADEVRARVREASGIESLASHPHGVFIKGSGTVAGMECTFEQVLTHDGRSTRRLVGPITMENGWDGKEHWVRDIGGEARVLGLGEELEARINAEIMSGAWHGSSSSFEFMLEQSESGAVVLAFTIPGAHTTGNVRIDAATWRPLRWEFTTGELTQTIDLEGDASLGELHVARSITEGSSNGASTVLTVSSVRPATAAEGARLVPDLAPPRDTTFNAAIPANLQVRRAPTGHLLVQPTINGKEVGWFIFDTGAGANVLSETAAETLGVERFGKVPAVGVGGATTASFVRPGALVLGPVEFDDPLMVVMDLKFLEPYMGVPVGGVIGYGLLARTVAEVDLVGAAIALHDPATYDRGSRVWAELLLDDRIPCVKASFEGHEGWFRLDTGANTTVTLHEPAVRRLNLLEGRATTSTQLGGVGGFIKAQKGTLQWFELGGNRIESPSAEFATEAKGAFGKDTTMGNIGTQMLAPFIIVLDYPASKVAFVKRDTPADAAPPGK